eukprot:g6139.t1
MLKVAVRRTFQQLSQRQMSNVPNMPNPNFYMRLGVKIAPWAVGGGLLGGWVVWPALPQLFPGTFGDGED